MQNKRKGSVMLLWGFVFMASSFFSATSFGQTTLEFNQVLLLSTSTNSNISLGTVSVGKVWKITGTGTEASYYYSCGISFNGSNPAFRVGAVDNYTASYTLVYEISDIWLPAGTTITALSCSYYRWLSIIEFNVVP